MSSVLQSLSDDLAAAVTSASRSVVAIHARRRIPSSGVLWRPGVVVTAHHTVQREDGIQVTLPDGSRAAATLAGRDPTTDIAVLRVDAGGAPSVERAEAATLRVGELVLALGMPGPAVTASLGMISSVGGEWRTWHGGRIDRFIRLDLAIYDGFSGGPLVDASGRVVGVNSSGLARASAMTIPGSTVDRVADQLLATGHVRRGYIGLGLQPVRLPASVVKNHSLPHDVGLLVVSLEEEAPAHQAGVSIGDVVIAFGGTPVSDPAELLSLLSGDRVGTTSTLRVLRGGAPLDLTLTVGERTAGGGR
jgi:S1-C subfamily serine protease